MVVSGPSAEGAFFEVLGLDVMRGRDFVAADHRDVPEVAIVTEALASQIFDGAALGQTLRVFTTLGGGSEADVRIVGIVESPVERSGKQLTGVLQPSGSGEVAAIFFPSPFPSPVQQGTARTLYVRSADAAALAPSIRDLAARIDPKVPILELATLDQKLHAGLQLERGLARAAALLGIVTLLLASVGLYGVTAYSVAIRGREIAVRMALGAHVDRVVGMVLRQALAIVTIGAVLGGLAAIGAGLLIQAGVFGVSGVDVVTLGGSAALCAAAILLASLLPARRAARLDPMTVLREE
jgi:hypothetical protein